MSEVADKHKMEERWCPVFVLLLMWMMAVGGMGAVIKPRDSHTWAVTEWTECSTSCGGVRIRSVHCVNSHGLISDGCQSQKPLSLVPCNLNKCPTAGLHPRHTWLKGAGRKETSIIDNTPMETGYRASTNHLQPAKQTSSPLLEWTVSDWSECSATCGGGFRVRSVRCLDECGIISPQYQRCNTSKDSRPSTFDFCAQRDCTTGTLDRNILPPNGAYSSSIPDGSFSVLDFMSTAIERYQLSQNITESDGTLTLLMETVTDGMTTFSCQTRPVDTLITVGQPQGINVIFISGEFLFELDCVVTTIVEIRERVTYDGSTVTIQERNIQFMNITTFWYCDSFRCYMFDSSKSTFERTGPTSKLFTSKNIALYSIAGQINSDIEDILLDPPPIIIATTLITDTAPLTPTPTSVMMSSSIFFASSESTMVAGIKTSPVTPETSSIATTTNMSPSPTFSVADSLMSSSPPLTTTVLTSSPSLESVTPTSVTITPTATLDRPSTSTVMSLQTVEPTQTMEPVDPTQDETLCPRKTPKSKPRKRKRKPLSKPRPEGKTIDTRKDTGDRTRTLKTLKSETKRKSKLRMSKDKTKVTTTSSFTIRRKTKCPPEKTKEIRTGRRTMKKPRSRNTFSTRPQSTSKSSNTVERGTAMTLASRHKTSLSKMQRKWGRGKTSAEVILIAEHKLWYCNHLAYVEAILSSQQNYKPHPQKMLDIKYTNIGTEKEVGKSLEPCKPGIDCTPQGKIPSKAHLKVSDSLDDQMQLAVCQHQKEKGHFICCMHPETVEGDLRCQAPEHKDMFSREQFYLLVLVASRDEHLQGWSGNNRGNEVHLLCCSEHECEDSEIDPT